jgi:hypothetical protein
MWQLCLVEYFEVQTVQYGARLLLQAPYRIRARLLFQELAEPVVTTSVDHTATVPSVVLGSGPTQSLSGAHGISATIRTELRDSSTRHVEGAIESSVIIAVGAVYSQYDVNSVPTFSSDNSAGMTASSNDRVHYTSTEPTQSSSPALVAVASTLQTVGAAHEPTSLAPSPTTDKHELPVDAVVQPSTGVGAQGTPVHGSSLIPQSATSAFVPVTLTTPPASTSGGHGFIFPQGHLQASDQPSPVFPSALQHGTQQHGTIGTCITPISAVGADYSHYDVNSASTILSDRSAGSTAALHDMVHDTSTSEPGQSSPPALYAGTYAAGTLQTVGAAHEQAGVSPAS